MNGPHALPPPLQRLRAPALLAGLLGLGACGLGFFVAPRHQVLLSYLFGYLFWLGLSLGSLAILMLQHLTGGFWGLIIRRILEAAAQVLPLLALLFLPLLFGLGALYPWAEDPHAAEGASPLRRAYLEPAFFTARAIAYFTAWITLALLLGRWSRREDESGHGTLGARFQRLSAVGLLLYGLTATFASVDWVMSLSPHWHSTIHGALFIVGQALAAMAACVALAVPLAAYPPLAGIVRPAHLQDLGNLLLAFVMLWAYMSFSQFLIIWGGNIAEEVPYYIYRGAGGWEWMALSLFVFHFVIPFLLLLSRWIKRRAQALGMIAAGILLLRLPDLFWLVVPQYAQGRETLPVPGIGLHWLDLAAPLGIGGLWTALFLRRLSLSPLLPLNDPRLVEAHGHG
jgi:hypothetical protein